jgi:hypothetical protein
MLDHSSLQCTADLFGAKQIAQRLFPWFYSLRFAEGKVNVMHFPLFVFSHSYWWRAYSGQFCFGCGCLDSEFRLLWQLFSSSCRLAPLGRQKKRQRCACCTMLR